MILPLPRSSSFFASSSRGASVDALRVDFKFLEMAECCFKAGLKNKAGIDFFSKTNKQTGLIFIHGF